jgi:hypothetical protein
MNFLLLPLHQIKESNVQYKDIGNKKELELDKLK